MRQPQIPLPGEECLEVSLLGPPQVQLAGHKLNIPRRIVRGMLYFLASRLTPVSRAALCLLFWPECGESEARRNLTRALTHLRRALPQPQALVTDGDLVYLDAQAIWCDVVEFRYHSNLASPGAALQRALDLYRGPFLEGFYLTGCQDFEDWLTQERTALEASYLNGLSGMMEQKIAQREYAQAVQVARRYLEIDALAEEVHRRLIALYALTGDRARALRQYELCITVLENELGAKPLPATQAVYRLISEGKTPSLQPEPAEGFFPTSMKTLRLDIPLIGRAPAMQHLQAALDQVKKGKGKIVLVAGEAGMGKSRLLYEFARRSYAQAQVLIGAGQSVERSVPYYPVVEALRSAVVDHPVSLPSHWLAEVSRLLPELSETYPDLPPPFTLKGEEARIRLFDALSQYLFAQQQAGQQQAAQQQAGSQQASEPLILCLDDLHWFDPTSLSWLVHLSRKLLSGRNPVLVIGTYRPEEAKPVQELRENLAHLNLLDEIRLEGFSAQEILEVFQHIFMSLQTREKFALRLNQATGGNPFYILESLQALEEAGMLAGNLDELVDLPLAERVREVVNWRINQLNPGSRQVLEAGAVLGAPFSFRALQFTAGRSEIETSLSLDTLVDRQIFTAENDSFRFHHDLIRRVALLDIGPNRLRILHARAGKVLEKLEPDSAAILAHHFDAAGEWRKALLYHKLSAQQAEALFAWQETEVHLERIMALLQKGCSPEEQKDVLAQQAHVLAKLIHIHYLQGKLTERDEALLRLEALASASDDPMLRLQAVEQRVRQLNNDARYPDVIAEAEKGLALLSDGANAASRGRLLAQMGHAYQLLGQPSQALGILQQAQTCISGDHDLELRAIVLDNLGLVYQMTGNYQPALQFYLEAITCRQQHGDHYSVIPYLRVVSVYLNLCRFAEARQYLDESLRMAHKSGVPAYEGHTLIALSGWHVYQGEPVAAIDFLQQALEILEALRNQNLIASAKASLGFAYYHLADLENGRKWLMDGLALLQSIGHKTRMALALVQLAVLEATAGHLMVAWEKLETGLAIARAIEYNDLVLTGQICTAFLERQVGSCALAKENAEQALRGLQGSGLGGLEMWAHMEAGLALVNLGDLEAALAHTQAAVDLIPRAHQLWVNFEQVHLAHSRVLRLSGDYAVAEEHKRFALILHLAKAARIPNPDLHRQFHVAFEKGISNLAQPFNSAD